jgi:hypothetical protein
MESVIGFSERVGDAHLPLNQMCLVLEQALKHGLREKRMALFSSKGVWGFFER